MKKEFGAVDILAYETLKSVMRPLINRQCEVGSMSRDANDEELYRGLAHIVVGAVIVIKRERTERYFRPTISFLIKRLEGEWILCKDSFLLHSCPESEEFSFSLNDDGTVSSSAEEMLELLRRRLA